MIRIIITTLFLLVLPLSSHSSEDIKQYSNKSITVSYPEDWKVSNLFWGHAISIESSESGIVTIVQSDRHDDLKEFAKEYSKRSNSFFVSWISLKFSDEAQQGDYRVLTEKGNMKLFGFTFPSTRIYHVKTIGGKKYFLIAHFSDDDNFTSEIKLITESLKKSSN